MIRENEIFPWCSIFSGREPCQRPPPPPPFAPPMSVLVEILFLALAYIFSDGEIKTQPNNKKPTNQQQQPFPHRNYSSRS